MQNRFNPGTQPQGMPYQMPPQQPQNAQSQNIPPQMNHGGHEIFDLHEIIAGMINVLDQYMMFRLFIKDPELLDILDRQYRFILDQYNITCECFTTGKDPSHPTQSYKMTQSHDVVYGIKPTQPKKPNQSIMEIQDKGISAHMLGLIKSTASLLTMTSVEVTNPVVRRVLADSVPNFIEMAYEIFLYQNKHQYYQVPQLAPNDMNQMTNSYVPFTGQPQMPNPGQMNGYQR